MQSKERMQCYELSQEPDSSEMQVVWGETGVIKMEGEGRYSALCRKPSIF